MASGIELFRQESINIKDHFPSLNYSEGENDLPFIYGDILLHDTEGGLIDNYSVKIVPTDEYPSKLPLVFETEGRIPINVDWHVFSDGHCCLMSIPQETLTCKKGVSLTSFIKNEVWPYFYNQKYRELNGFFLKERSHGNRGHIEFFQDLLMTSNLAELAKLLLFVLERQEPNRVEKCFCNSGLKYRKCHRNAYRDLILFSDSELQYFTEMIMKEI